MDPTLDPNVVNQMGQVMAGLTLPGVPLPDFTPQAPVHAAPFADGTSIPFLPAQPDPLGFLKPAPPASTGVPMLDWSLNGGALPDIGSSEFGMLDPSAIENFKSVYDGLAPYAHDFANLAADQSAAKKNETAVVQGGQNGLSVAEQERRAKAAAVAEATRASLAATAHLPTDHFNDLMAQYDAIIKGRPLPPTLNQTPQAPNGWQLAAAALAALANPHGATQALATPFQSAMQEDQRKKALALQQYALQQQAYNQQLDGVTDMMKTQNSRDVQEAGLQNDALNRGVTLAGQDENTKRTLLNSLDNSDSVARIKASFAALDAEGYSDLVPQETRDAILADAQKKQDDRDSIKREQDIEKYTVAAQNPWALPAGRVSSIQSAISLIAAHDPNDPRIAILQAQAKAYGELSPSQQSKKEQTDSTIALNQKKGAQIDARTQDLAIKYQIDAKRLSTYDQEFQSKIAQRELERRNIESQIAARGLSGQLAMQRAQAKAAGLTPDAGGLSKSDVKLLTSESQALAKEVSVLKAQRAALVDKITGQLRQGSQSTAQDLDQRIAAIGQRQGEIGATFRLSREADQRARQAQAQAQARRQPPAMQGNLPPAGPLQPNTPLVPPKGSGQLTLPPGWSYGGKR